VQYRLHCANVGACCFGMQGLVLIVCDGLTCEQGVSKILVFVICNLQHSLIAFVFRLSFCLHLFVAFISDLCIQCVLLCIISAYAVRSDVLSCSVAFRAVSTVEAVCDNALYKLTLTIESRSLKVMRKLSRVQTKKVKPANSTSEAVKWRYRYCWQFLS